MKAIRRESPIALPDLARAWKCSVEQIELWGVYDGLEIISEPVGNGSEVRAVKPEEVERFKANKSRFPDGRFNPSDKRSHQQVIIQLLAMYYGGDGIPDKPYSIAAEVEKFTAAAGLHNPISNETAAKIIRGALLVGGFRAATSGAEIQTLDASRNLDTAGARVA